MLEACKNAIVSLILTTNEMSELFFNDEKLLEIFLNIHKEAKQKHEMNHEIMVNHSYNNNNNNNKKVTMSGITGNNSNLDKQHIAKKQKKSGFEFGSTSFITSDTTNNDMGMIRYYVTLFMSVCLYECVCVCVCICNQANTNSVFYGLNFAFCKPFSHICVTNTGTHCC